MSSLISSIPIKVKESLPEVASRAAVELDNLRLHRRNGLSALSDLVNSLTHMSRSNEPHYYPNDALVILQAISNAHFNVGSRPLQTTNELFEATKDIEARLQAVVSRPDELEEKSEELVRLRTFCIELSKSALSYSQNNYSRPRHPFRM
jgi:hypothetical protein